ALSKMFLLFFVQEKGLKITNLHPWSESVCPQFFRMTSLGKRMTTIYFRTTQLLQLRSPLRWGRVMGTTMWPTHTMDVPAESHATLSQKKRLGKGRDHGEVPRTYPRAEH